MNEKEFNFACQENDNTDNNLDKGKEDFKKILHDCNVCVLFAKDFPYLLLLECEKRPLNLSLLQGTSKMSGLNLFFVVEIPVKTFSVSIYWCHGLKEAFSFHPQNCDATLLFFW